MTEEIEENEWECHGEWKCTRDNWKRKEEGEEKGEGVGVGDPFPSLSFQCPLSITHMLLSFVSPSFFRSFFTLFLFYFFFFSHLSHNMLTFIRNGKGDWSIFPHYISVYSSFFQSRWLLYLGLKTGINISRKNFLQLRFSLLPLLMKWLDAR